jgi:hypothetical protein
MRTLVEFTVAATVLEKNAPLGERVSVCVPLL